MRTVALLAFSLTLARGATAAPSDAAARLVGGALAGGHSFALAQSLADGIGPRMAGSEGAARAVEWAVRAMERAGLKRVHREPVKVPRWVRGAESVELTAPAPQRLHATTLGGSIGTAPDGVTAEVVEVASFEELKALGARARGKVVLFNKPMERTRDFAGYGGVVPLRSRGAVEASRAGAVAALVRSVGTGAFRLPHTGAMRYDPDVRAIPTAAIAAEDADLIHRLTAAGEKVKIRLHLGAHEEGEVDSANVVGEIPGREREVVLLGAHLDSWDLGTGAIDDAAGCAIVIEAARLIAALGAPPRRTVRVVLFMNEEHGLSGAHAYAERHQSELARHAAAIEADAGAGRPFGFALPGGTPSEQALKPLLAPLATLRAASVTSAPIGGADLVPLQARGVPVLGLAQDMSGYFDWHHTAADTVDKIDPFDLALDAAAMAVAALALAESPTRLPPSPPPPEW